MASSIMEKDLKSFKDSEIDDLLSKLTAEELEELHIELVDPDDPHIPAADRCRYKTDKEPSGPFNREKLLDYLEKKASEEKDWSQNKPFVKETKGKVWKPKVEETPVLVTNQEKIALDAEWDEALNQATEEELVDLAAVLGFHGMLNQNQYHHAFVSGKQAKDLPGGLQTITKCEPCKHFDMEMPNNTDVVDSLKRLKNNDASLTELNLNNIKNIPSDLLSDIFSSLKNNTSLTKLHLANIGLTDGPAKSLVESLKQNSILTYLNVESNFLSGVFIVDLLRSINMNQKVTEFKVANQRPGILGVKNEMELSKLVRENKTLLKFGVFMEGASSRAELSKYIQRNNDAFRKERIAK